jgi:hypothetical protein
MKTTTKKMIAREWLYLLLFLEVGIIVIPYFDAFILGAVPPKDIRPFYLALVGKESGSLKAWVLATAPYILWQLVRSTWWALKQLKGR